MNNNPWNDIYREYGSFFGEPHADMPGVVQLLNTKGAQTVLDLGCGTGRHVVYLAQKGFSVYGLDSSSEGIEITRNRLAKNGVAADLRLQEMTESLPYQDAFFDAVISIQVIHHALLADIRRVVGEITRVLKKGAFIFITVPKQKNQYNTYREIEPNTFIPMDGLEIGLPHHFFTPAELREVFKDFDITDIHFDTTAHYCMSAFKG